MPEFNVVPINKTLLVEGTARRSTFRGLVIAIGWYDEQGVSGPRRKPVGAVPPPDVHYLVSDESQPAPFWADARQITSQQWFPVPRAAEPAD